MTIEQWITIATRKLAPESAEQVRREIGEHFQCALAAGNSDIASLGDPRKANRQYRKVLLTAPEAKLIKGVFPDFASWWKYAILGVSNVLICAGAWAISGHSDLVWRAWPIGVLLLLQYAGPLLCPKTPQDLRIWRIARGAGFIVGMVFLITTWNWMSYSIMAQFFFVSACQIRATVIRRKLSSDRWPVFAYI